jgi:hypothetical protein
MPGSRKPLVMGLCFSLEVEKKNWISNQGFKEDPRISGFHKKTLLHMGVLRTQNFREKMLLKLPS